jgi:hypothetical protein
MKPDSSVDCSGKLWRTHTFLIHAQWELPSRYSTKLIMFLSLNHRRVYGQRYQEQHSATNNSSQLTQWLLSRPFFFSDATSFTAYDLAYKRCHCLKFHAASSNERFDESNGLTEFPSSIPSDIRTFSICLTHSCSIHLSLPLCLQETGFVA